MSQAKPQLRSMKVTLVKLVSPSEAFIEFDDAVSGLVQLCDFVIGQARSESRSCSSDGGIEALPWGNILWNDKECDGWNIYEYLAAGHT